MKKIGIMISSRPKSAEFEKGMATAQKALAHAQVYLYLIDSAVEAMPDPRFEKFKSAGGHLFVCAYSVQKRGLNPSTPATQTGLTILSDIMSSTDEFHSFN